MTAEELLAMPDDPNIIRELFDGEPMTRKVTKGGNSHSLSDRPRQVVRKI
jgi:hypothetical protein